MGIHLEDFPDYCSSKCTSPSMAAKTADELSKLALNGAATTKSNPQINGTNGVNGHLSDPDDSDDDKDDDATATGGAGNTASGAAKKKKKKKPNKKKKAGAAKVQSDPPRVLVSQLFPNEYPVGEEVEYKNDNAYRTTNEEKRHLDRMNNDFLQEYRKGAEVHRQVRKWAQANVKPGMTLTEIAEGIENGTRALTGHWGLEEGDNIKGGVGFPTGLSINHIAAHYTPNAGNKWVLGEQDVMKVDFGVHVNGRIVDSAFTMTFDPKYDNLLAAVKDATSSQSSPLTARPPQNPTHKSTARTASTVTSQIRTTQTMTKTTMPSQLVVPATPPVAPQRRRKRRSPTRRRRPVPPRFSPTLLVCLSANYFPTNTLLAKK